MSAWIEEQTITVGGNSTCFQYKDFLQYLAFKSTTLAEVLSLTVENRWNLYLKWKHGLTGTNPGKIDMSVSWALERELQKFLSDFKHLKLEDIELGLRETVKCRRQFEEYCSKVKSMLGIGRKEKAKEELPKEIQNLTKAVGGKVITWQP